MIAVLLLALAGFPIHSISVEGNSLLPAEGIRRASGLQIGQEATPADFDAAVSRLMATGLVESAHYRYRPSPDKGYDLTLEISEPADRHAAKLEVPGWEESRLWEALAAHDPLLVRQIPGSEPAAVYYARAIEAFLAGEGRAANIVAKMRVDASGNLVTVFRPAELPKIEAVRFQGNRALGADALEKAVAPASLGSEYSETGFRELLARTALPLYEAQGRLRAAFPAIAFDRGTVTVSVAEGPVYTLGNVEVACQGVPREELLQAAAFETGRPANWRKVAASVANLQNLLARRGYLDSASEIERSLDDRTLRADLIVSIQKGPRSVFGELQIVGLKGGAEARARNLWTLPSGTAMDTDYVDRYLRLASADPQVRRAGFKTAGRRLRPRPGTNVVDVTVTFE